MPAITEKPLARTASPGSEIKRVPKKAKKTKRFKEKPVDPISHEGILLIDIKQFLESQGIDEELTHNDMDFVTNLPRDQANPNHKVVRAKVDAISSVGDGIALYRGEDGLQDPKVVVVPYSVPGDTVEVKIYKTNLRYFDSELISVVEPSPDRDDSLVKCKYFAKCSGCQYQQMPYGKQLELKRNVIQNAYKHFASKLEKDQIPDILPTVASPLEYNYRTKLTPHFDVPKKGLNERPSIGFNQKGRRAVVDIEECVIGTEILQPALTQERQRILDSFDKFKKGATLLLRESSSTDDDPTHRICVTSTKETIIEHVDQFKFHYPASAFFQNNNSILPEVTKYVRENIVLPSTGRAPKYLVDTYCGSGLFAVTCSPAVEKVIGVEISKDSVQYAEKNAQLNNLTNASFIVGEAQKIFEKVDTPADETSIIIDPPRKGCDTQFLDQLLLFKPAKVVYVSCNVHSQARDVEYLLMSPSSDYQIESIRGFDFFPQTHHVESVAVLSRRIN
jgi:tRNA (uracil-5-)-methyltransferase